MQMVNMLIFCLFFMLFSHVACSSDSTVLDGDASETDNHDGDVPDGDPEAVDDGDNNTDGDEKTDQDLEADDDFGKESEAEPDADPEYEADDEPPMSMGSISGTILTQAAYLDLLYTVFVFDRPVDVDNFPRDQAMASTIASQKDIERQTRSFSFSNQMPGEYYLYAETHTCHPLGTSADPTTAIAANVNPISLGQNGAMSPETMQFDFSERDLSCRTIPRGTASISGVLHTPVEFLGLLTRIGATKFDAGKLGNVAQIISPSNPVIVDEDRLDYPFSLTQLPSGSFEMVLLVDRNNDGAFYSIRELGFYAYSPILLQEGEQLTGMEFYAFIQDPSLASISGTIHTLSQYLISIEYSPHAFRRPIDSPEEQVQIASEVAGNPNPLNSTLTYTLLNFPDGKYWIQNLIDRCPGIDNLWGELSIDYPANPIVVDTSVSKDITGIDFDVTTEDLSCPPPGQGHISGTIVTASPYLISDGYNYFAMIFDQEPEIGIDPLFWANCRISDSNHPEILSFEMSNLPQGSYYLILAIEVCRGSGQGVQDSFVFFSQEQNPVTVGPGNWTVSDANFNFSGESLACVSPIECSGDEGNEHGVGMACTTGGGECPQGLYCLPDIVDLFAGISDICVLTECRSDQECGTGAGCLDLVISRFCVPLRCMADLDRSP